jgi:UDP-N-acetylmuramyl pentapeptide phosphotransferase/UDP-N-acetylglucosamine-1-phosphate transferase
LQKRHSGVVVSYAVVVFVLGILVTPAAICALSRLEILDVPNYRSSHSIATVRGAGIGVAVVATAALSAAAIDIDRGLLVVALAAATYAGVGFVDDLRGLSVRYRLPLQVLIGAAAVLSIEITAPRVVVVLSIVAVVGYLNAFNFMDGINGISCLHAAAIGLTWGAAGLLSAAASAVLLGGMLAAAALAFLPFNFPRARGFLGDVGSYFFGGWIAVSAVVLYGRVPLLVIGLPLVPYVADTAWTLLRRIRRGAIWHEAHREHVYQRLVAVGWSHSQSAGLIGGFTLAAGGGGLVSAYVLEESFGGTVIVLLVAITAAGYLVLPSRLEASGEEEGTG